MGGGKRMAPRVLDLSTEWTCVIRFTSQLLLLMG